MSQPRFRPKSQAEPRRLRLAWIAHRMLKGALLGLVLAAAATPNDAAARDWPWKSKPDILTAACSLDRNEVLQGSSDVLHAKIATSESKGHPLSYVWSGNGGKIDGAGSEVKVDASGLNPGVYSIRALAQDAYQHSASCLVSFRVLRPPDSITMKACSAVPPVVEQGKEAVLDAEASDALGHSLHYHWYTNGGKLEGDGPQVKLETAGLRPGVYSVTGRVEDDWGLASDCTTTVKVASPPPPPPPPPEPSNVAEIVFPPNRETLQENDETQLRRVLGRLNADPTARVSIEAYAGPDEGNPSKLAAERADTVKRYFLANGITESRVHTLVGLGGRRGGVRNRTLDIIWLPKGLDY